MKGDSIFNAIINEIELNNFATMQNGLYLTKYKIQSDVIKDFIQKYELIY